VPEALEQLRSLGRTLVVVSNSDGTVERVLEQQGLRHYLDAVFDSHIVGFEKPDSRFFLHALEATGARAETTLHVGDLYSADIEGGRAAGVHTALVDPFDDWDGVDCPRFKDLGAISRAFRANVGA
jgi:putative hydrolase of the HAD superfamily